MSRDSRVQDLIRPDGGASRAGPSDASRIASTFGGFVGALPPLGSAAARQPSRRLPARCVGAADPGSHARER